MVTLKNEDGVTLSGTFYPAKGDTAVLLTHMGIADQTSWQDFAMISANKGIAALTFDFQCYGKSECKARGGDMSNLKDVRPAYDFLQEKGYKRIVCMGASMGGTACLMLAMEKELAGLVVIASERPIGTGQYPKDLISKSIPKLFIVADHDPYAFVISEIQTMYDVSSEPKQLKIFSGNVHGTDLFKTEHGMEFQDLLIEFLEECFKATFENQAQVIGASFRQNQKWYVSILFLL
jgi:pimeloyl-ACP methyl ester carboxylesterase